MDFCDFHWNSQPRGQVCLHRIGKQFRFSAILRDSHNKIWRAGSKLYTQTSEARWDAHATSLQKSASRWDNPIHITQFGDEYVSIVSESNSDSAQSCASNVTKFGARATSCPRKLRKRDGTRVQYHCKKVLVDGRIPFTLHFGLWEATISRRPIVSTSSCNHNSSHRHLATLVLETGSAGLLFPFYFLSNCNDGDNKILRCAIRRTARI